MYRVIMQFIPGNNQIWVAKLNSNDPEYVYDNEQEALDKAAELQSNDNTGREYKVEQLQEL